MAVGFRLRVVLGTYLASLMPGMQAKIWDWLPGWPVNATSMGDYCPMIMSRSVVRREPGDGWGGLWPPTSAGGIGPVDPVCSGLAVDGAGTAG